MSASCDVLDGDPDRGPGKRTGCAAWLSRIGGALILKDIQLPGMNGIEALGRPRAEPETRGIPVLAVTASAMSHDRTQILAAGFDGYEPKPIAVRPFLAAVRAAGSLARLPHRHDRHRPLTQILDALQVPDHHPGRRVEPGQQDLAQPGVRRMNPVSGPALTALG